ncbi:hypothetical protein TNCV_3388861 [Trichonephila clavipes]|nr:hypothetical protein TNCV_3388861 [Trichonephila clavipes]
MDEQLKALLEGINALKSGQEELTADAPCESRCIKEIEKSKEQMQALIAQHQNRRRCSITCWGCGEQGHLRTATETIRKIAAPSAGGVVEQGT